MRTLIAALVFASGSIAFAERVPGIVYFENLKDGQTVTSPVTLKFGIKGMKLRAAGEDANDKKSGHHHLIVDAGPVPEGQVVPADEKHLHFGKAQTEAEIALTPGEHTLTLQLADGAHRSYGEKMSSTIRVKVTGAAPDPTKKK